MKKLDSDLFIFQKIPMFTPFVVNKRSRRSLCTNDQSTCDNLKPQLQLPLSHAVRRFHHSKTTEIMQDEPDNTKTTCMLFKSKSTLARILYTAAGKETRFKMVICWLDKGDWSIILHNYIHGPTDAHNSDDSSLETWVLIQFVTQRHELRIRGTACYGSFDLILWNWGGSRS